MKKPPFLRTPYNYDQDEVSESTGLDCTGDPGQTQQQFAKESDINEIVRRFGLTGELPNDYRAPMYGDFTDVMDFQSAMQAVTAAQQQFLQMPGELRARFNNDPQRLMDFLDDPTNRPEAEKLGLVPQKTQVQSTPPQPTAPTNTPT